uniref:SelP_N domain-containing protein n=1 Tax=Wuchereria bancrofti TaxID=6293 RepID=A0AAF5Q336_WUCBA
MYYSNVVPFDILLLLLSIIIFVRPVVKSTPILCSQTKSWKLGGRDIIADSKGFVLLVALMPMECEHCQEQLMKFQTVMETLSEIRIVVIAPYDENPRLIERYRKEFSRVTIGMESLDERIWDTLSGSGHDHFIYDRCGRLASVIRHPKSDTSKSEHTLRALKSAISYAQCGWCQYDPPDLPQEPVITTYASLTRKGKTRRPRIKAVVYPQNDRADTLNSGRRSALDHERFSPRFNTATSTRKDHASDYVAPSNITSPSVTIENNQKEMVIRSESQQQQQVSMHKQGTISQQTQPEFEIGQERVTTKSNNDWRASSGWIRSRPFSNRKDQDGSQQQQWKKEERHRKEKNRRNQEQEHLEQLRIQQEHQQRIREQEEEQRKIQEQRRFQEIQRQYEERQNQEQQRFQQQELEKRMEQRKLHEQKTVSEFYTDVSTEEHERRFDSKDKNNWRQFEVSSHQQHLQEYTKTTMVPFGSNNPAAKTSILYDVGDGESDYDYSQATSETTIIPTKMTQILNTKPLEHSQFLFEHQVPCAAFTDQVCIEQKKRIGADKMSKCCDKGVYLTDICVPGRCTNATIELCCMQKFLQSKYKCCLNDSAAINSPGDAFSRCCFHKFVQNNDKCCPAHRAKFHWLTAYEICLPNVRVDLSGLRFSVHSTNNLDTNSGNRALNDIITIDLNADRSWDHSCEQGAKVLQFPYLPNDKLGNEKEDDENSEENR